MITQVTFDFLGEEQRRAQAQHEAMLRSIDEANAQKERQRQEVELRENRLAALAEGQEARERRRERRERLVLVLTIATLLVALVAAIASLIAIN